jgi:type III pantothenate kinase
MNKKRKAKSITSKAVNTIVAMDIGNTATTIAVVRKGRITKVYCYKSNNIPSIYLNIRQKWGKQSSFHIIIASVVPFLSVKIKKYLKRRFPQDKVYQVGRHVKPRIRMKYDRNSLGADRLVNVFGARHLYKLPCLIIDFGTATTFDVISSRGVFEGGLIVPGVGISASALENRAVLLPKFNRTFQVRSFIGRSTQGAMASGLVSGFAALADGLIEQFKAKFGRGLQVVATGGFAAKLAPYCRLIDKVDLLHTVRSLVLIYEKMIRSHSYNHKG